MDPETQAIVDALAAVQAEVVTLWSILLWLFRIVLFLCGWALMAFALRPRAWLFSPPKR